MRADTESLERELYQGDQLTDAHTPHPAHRERVNIQVSLKFKTFAFFLLVERFWLARQR